LTRKPKKERDSDFSIRGRQESHKNTIYGKH